MEITLALLAGFFGGTCLALGYCVRVLHKQNRKTDGERMRALNKCFIREGQSTLFTEHDIDPDKEPIDRTKGTTKTISSPFSAGLKKTREQLEHEDRVEFGSDTSNIPDSLKENIKRGVAKVMGKAA